MAKIDYWAIREEVRETIVAGCPGFTVELERDMAFSVEQTPWVGIYIDRREAPPERQSLSGGRRVAYRVPVTLWIWCYALELEQGMRTRDDALGDMELALLGNPTLNDLVDRMWLNGGRMYSGKDNQGGFLAGAELVLVTEVSMFN